MKITSKEVPDLPSNFSKNLNKLLKKLMNKEQDKRYSIDEVLSIYEVRKSCQKLLEKFPNRYKDIIVLNKKKNLILDLSYEDSDEDNRHLEMINMKFKLHEDMSKMMNSDKNNETNTNNSNNNKNQVSNIPAFLTLPKALKSQISQFFLLFNKQNQKRTQFQQPLMDVIENYFTAINLKNLS
jgi:serine/threonine protein kinase